MCAPDPSRSGDFSRFMSEVWGWTTVAMADATVRAIAVLAQPLSPPEHTLIRCHVILLTRSTLSTDTFTRLDHVSGWSKLATYFSTARLSGGDEGARLIACASRSNAALAAACMTCISPP
jgi:hypothetical protein